MDKYRKTAIIYYFTAVITFVCSVICFCNGKGTLGVIWLGVGAANLCLGTVWMNRSGKSEKPKKQEEGKQEKKI